MKKWMDKVKSAPLTWVLGALLAVQFLLIVYCNLFLLDKSIDCDTAKMFVHLREMWNQKTLFIQDWIYASTLELDCGSLLVLPFYGLIKDIFLAYGLSNICLCALYLRMVFFLFRGKKAVYPIFCCNLLLIPYGFGMLEYFNMMFFNGSQYVLKTMVPLLLVGILVATEREKEDQHKWGISRETLVFAVIFVVLLFFCSLSSGVYVMASGVAPVLVAYAGYKFACWTKVPKPALTVGGLTVVAFLAGYGLNEAYMSGALGNQMIMCPSSYLPMNSLKTFVGTFEIFGGLKNTLDLSVLSVDGILTLAKLGLVVVFWICAICMCKWILGKKADLRGILLVSIFAWNYMVLLLTYNVAASPTSEYRYHLVGVVPLVCVAVLVLLHFLERLTDKQRRLLIPLCVLLLVVIMAGSFRDVFKVGEQNAAQKEISSYFAQQHLGADYIYFYDASSDAEICRLLDDSNEYLHVEQNGLTGVCDYYSMYNQAPIYPDNSIMVVDENRYQLGEQFELFGFTFRRFDEVAGRGLYYFGNEN